MSKYIKIHKNTKNTKKYTFYVKKRKRVDLARTGEVAWEDACILVFFFRKITFFTFLAITRRPDHEKNNCKNHSKGLFEAHLSRGVPGSVPRLKR